MTDWTTPRCPACGRTAHVLDYDADGYDTVTVLCRNVDCRQYDNPRALDASVMQAALELASSLDAARSPGLARRWTTYDGRTVTGEYLRRTYLAATGCAPRAHERGLRALRLVCAMGLRGLVAHSRPH